MYGYWAYDYHPYTEGAYKAAEAATILWGVPLHYGYWVYGFWPYGGYADSVVSSLVSDFYQMLRRRRKQT